MAYVNVPKDLTKIKSKVLFNLTKRQLICLGLAALMGVPLFFLLKGGIGTTAAAMVMIVVMLPGFLLGVYEKNGQPLEVVGRQITDHAIADGKDVEHDVHPVSHQGFGCHKANEVMHGSLRAFEFMEIGSVFEQRYGEEQHDQRIADADHRIVQACLLYTSPSPRDLSTSRMPSSA